MKKFSSQITKKSFGEYLYTWFLSAAKLLNTILFQKDKKNKLSYILCYHSISNDEWRFSTDLENFSAQMQYLSKTKKIVSLNYLLKNLTNSNQISLTFDDGYKDFLTNALPILNKYKITGTLFVLGTPEKANRKALDNNKQMLTINEIKQLKNQGWEIGFHTNTHTSLTSLTTEELKKEIIDGKKNLEKKLGFSLRYFAYPMGEYSDKVIQIVKEAGFEAGFSTNGGNVSLKNTSDIHIVDRICLEGKLNLKQFTSLLTPMGLLFNKIFFNMLKAKIMIMKLV